MEYWLLEIYALPVYRLASGWLYGVMGNRLRV